MVSSPDGMFVESIGRFKKGFQYNKQEIFAQSLFTKIPVSPSDIPE